MNNTNTILLVLILFLGIMYVYQNKVAQQVTVVGRPLWGGMGGWGGWGRRPWGRRGGRGGHHRR